MLATVFTKTIRDRWIGMTVAAGTLGLFLVYGMAVYRQIDISLYRDLPEAIRELFGFGDAVDAGGLAYGAIYGFSGAITLAALAISMGSGAVAGEERKGTMGLLLGNPKSRGHVVISKAGAMIALVSIVSVALWAVGWVVPRLLDVDVSAVRPGSLMLHMLANALFYGFLALAVGAWTGNATAASGTAAGVMVVSYLAVGVLPLIEGARDFAKAFPWYYYDGGSPVTNGVQWGHLGVLAGAVAVFAVAALLGFDRRDVRERSLSVSLADRLRANPRTRQIMDRIAGSTRVSRIWLKTASEHQGLLVVTGYIVVLMGITMGPFYNLIDDAIKDFADQFPRVLLAAVGFADMGTPEGWYQVEVFSLTLPITLIVLSTVMGARALAGEEGNRTMGLLLANPVPRSRVVVEKTLALVVAVSVLGFLSFIGTVIGSAIGGLGIGAGAIAAASSLLTLLGLVFGGVALALSAATGQVKVAAFGTAGISLGFFVLNAFLPLSDSVGGYAAWSPWYYYLTSNPLVNGMDWGHATVNASLFLLLVAASVVLFERRDLRQSG